MPESKKKVIKSLDTLNEDLQNLIKKQYPGGYEGSLTRITTPKKETIFVFPLETDDTTFLVKVPATKNSDGEYDVRHKKKREEFDLPGAGEDDLEGEGGDDLDQGDNYDDDDSVSASNEPGYEPDFDN